MRQKRTLEILKQIQMAQLGYELIEKEVEKITNPKVKETAIENIEAIRNQNRRDFYF